MQLRAEVVKVKRAIFGGSVEAGDTVDVKRVAGLVDGLLSELKQLSSIAAIDVVHLVCRPPTHWQAP